MKYKVKPTDKQRRAFENIERGMVKREAMLAAGYTDETAQRPKANLTDRRGYQELIEEYRYYLRKAGVTPDILSEVQVEGLFDQDARVRLEYLKENKKDFGLYKDPALINNVEEMKVVVVIPSEIMQKHGISSNTESGSEGQNNL